jgi:hypothetical protein
MLTKPPVGGDVDVEVEEDLRQRSQRMLNAASGSERASPRGSDFPPQGLDTINNTGNGNSNSNGPAMMSSLVTASIGANASAGAGAGAGLAVNAEETSITVIPTFTQATAPQQQEKANRIPTFNAAGNGSGSGNGSGNSPSLIPSSLLRRANLDEAQSVMHFALDISVESCVPFLLLDTYLNMAELRALQVPCVRALFRNRSSFLSPLSPYFFFIDIQSNCANLPFSIAVLIFFFSPCNRARTSRQWLFGGRLGTFSRTYSWTVSKDI